MSRHSFDPDIAACVGLNAAVIFQNITFWIEKNQANRRNFRDGWYWTYNSISAFGELFPYTGSSYQCSSASGEGLSGRLRHSALPGWWVARVSRMCSCSCRVHPSDHALAD